MFSIVFLYTPHNLGHCDFQHSWKNLCTWWIVNNCFLHTKLNIANKGIWPCLMQYFTIKSASYLSLLTRYEGFLFTSHLTCIHYFQSYPPHDLPELWLTVSLSVVVRFYSDSWRIHMVLCPISYYLNPFWRKGYLLFALVKLLHLTSVVCRWHVLSKKWLHYWK